MRSPSYEPAHCIVCGHARSEVVAETDEISAEVEALWEFHQRRLKPTTPVDRLRDRVAFSQHPPLRLVACADCGLVYRNPVERAFELESAYTRDCPPRDVLQALHAAQRKSYRSQAERLGELLPRGATVLEVGSYVGAFLGAAADAGLQASGIDINPAINHFTRSLGFHVDDGELAGNGETQLNGVAIWNTFDQLLDPRSVVMAARSRLKPEGILAIRVPNGDFYRRWARRRGARGAVSRALLAQNNLLAFPYRWGFTPGSLGRLVAECGLGVERVVGDVLVPTADQWTRPWARAEERLLKGLARRVSRTSPESAPWFELYARARGPAS